MLTLPLENAIRLADMLILHYETLSVPGPVCRSGISTHSPCVGAGSVFVQSTLLVFSEARNIREHVLGLGFRDFNIPARTLHTYH